MNHRPLSALLMLAALSAPAAAATYSFCAEPGDGPPWYYVHKDAGGGAQAAGFAVDMLRAAFQRMGHQTVFRIDVPWKRCLQLVSEGSIDFGVGAYYDPERAKRFAFSKPYKTLTPQIFFAAAHPIAVKRIEDLKRYRGCGMLGSSYAHYGIADGALDQGGHSYRAMIVKLKTGRCDYFPEELEVIAEIDQGRDHFLDDPELRHVPILGAKAPAMHLIAAKGRPAAALLPQFDAAFAALDKSGILTPMWRRHAGNLPY